MAQKLQRRSRLHIEGSGSVFFIYVEIGFFFTRYMVNGSENTVDGSTKKMIRILYENGQLPAFGTRKLHRRELSRGERLSGKVN
jgi:hypothetical protein